MGKETEQKQEIVNQGVHTYSQEEAYVWPEEPVLREQLEWFQDQKLALMVHWGVYNQLGMVASWALSDEDAEWSRKTVDWTDDGEVFKRQYRALNRAFDPVAFQPEEWAKMAKKCGFRYLILTTKHHDGFCLWDTAYTEYKTTAEDCPFHTHKYADIVRAMFDAFRKEKLGIGVYYSKADWHCPDYWEKEKVFTGKTTRNPTYNPKENPEAWERSVHLPAIRSWNLESSMEGWISSGLMPDGWQQQTDRISGWERSWRRCEKRSPGCWQ